MIEVLKQMVEALELNNSEWKELADSGDAGYWTAEEQDHYKQTEEAIEAGKQAIAELESQEPFGYFRYDIRLDAWVQNRDSNRGAALYTHPPQRTEQESVADDFFRMIADRNPKPFPPPQRTWVGLTTEETLDMFDLNNVYGSKWIEFARTVEAKLKEKNT
jgi:hypothetical protein